MRRLNIMVAILAAMVACTPKAPTIQPYELFGAWECIKGCEADYEFYQDETEYGFYVYSGERMNTSGTWELNRNRITLQYDDQEDKSYTILFEGDTLIFGEREMIFIPAISSTSTADEPCSLGYLPHGFLGLDFSEPQYEEFDWHYEAEDSSIEIAQIEGVAIETIVELRGDFSPIGEAFSTIGDYLKILEYESDMFNSTERADGYQMGDCVVVVLNTWDDWAEEDIDEGPPEEVVLKLLYGKLVK